MNMIENIGTDARNADGYIVLFKITQPKMTGVLAVPATVPRSVSLRKLRRVVAEHQSLSVQLEGFDIESRTVGKSRHANIFEIKFAVRTGMEDVTIPLFIEFMRQCNIITNPIVSDMRNFKVD